MKRQIDKVVLHCSATPEGRWHDAEDIRGWHVTGRGWSDIGYHFVILLDGTIEEGRPLHRPGAHVKGLNTNSIGICYIGGVNEYHDPKDTMTEEQEIAFEQLYCDLLDEYGDDITLHGHNEFANKACPSFDVADKFAHLM